MTYDLVTTAGPAGYIICKLWTFISEWMVASKKKKGMSDLNRICQSSNGDVVLWWRDQPYKFTFLDWKLSKPE